MDLEKWREHANILAKQQDADVLFYNGDIESPFDDKVIDLCLAQARRSNLILFLCTNGGDADAAYRISRCLQSHYKRFVIAICGKCKSAGTLVALGAHEVVMTDYAEIGPLDVQLGKKDELYETDSGLTVLNALSELEGKVYEIFERGYFRLKINTQGRMTLKTATEIATQLSVGMMAPVMSQIDPLHVGEVSRAMKIGKEYGKRLSTVAKNLQPKALDKLVDEYPSHGFVIDREEARKLFMNVRELTELEANLAALFGHASRRPKPGDPVLMYLSDKLEVVESNNDHLHEAGTTAGTEAAGAGFGAPTGTGQEAGQGSGSGEAKPSIAA